MDFAGFVKIVIVNSINHLPTSINLIVEIIAIVDPKIAANFCTRFCINSRFRTSFTFFVFSGFLYPFFHLPLKD